MFAVGDNDVSPRKELQEHVVHAIAERDVNNAISADLLNRSDASRSKKFAHAGHERGWHGSRRPRVLGDMASEA